MKNPISSLFTVLICIVLLLVGMNFFPASISVIVSNRFALNAEANVPTWYSTILLYSVSFVSFIIYFSGRKPAGQHSIWRFFWLAFGLMYLFFSLDEASLIHEIIDEVLSVKWIYIYGPIVGVLFCLILIYFISIRKDNKNVRNWIISGLVISAFGGLFMEFISYIFSPLPSAIQQLEFGLEEGFEMTGTIFVLIGCIIEVRNVFNSIK